MFALNLHKITRDKASDLTIFPHFFFFGPTHFLERSQKLPNYRTNKKYTSNSNFPDKVQVEIIKMITRTGLTQKNCRVQNLMTKIVKETRRVRQKESHQGHLMGICWTSSK